MMVKLRIVLPVVLLAAPALAHADRIKVAVVPGLAVNLDTARVDALGQDLAEALATVLDVDALGGLDVRRQLPPEGLAPDCVAHPACTSDVARRIGAQQLLFVYMTETGGGVQIDTTWLEPATGHQASRPAVDVVSTSDTEAKSKFESVAHQLLPDAPLRARPQAKVRVDLHAHDLADVPRHLTIASYATGGATIVALGFGIGFGLATRSSYNSCSAAPACSTKQRNTIRDDAAAADISFSVAVGAAIATSILFATSGEKSRLIVAPTASGAGATLSGSF